MTINSWFWKIIWKGMLKTGGSLRIVWWWIRSPSFSWYVSGTSFEFMVIFPRRIGGLYMGEILLSKRGKLGFVGIFLRTWCYCVFVIFMSVCYKLLGKKIQYILAYPTSFCISFKFIIIIFDISHYSDFYVFGCRDSLFHLRIINF